MKKLAKELLVILTVAVLMFSVAMTTSYATNTQNIDKKDNGSIKIENKSKTLNYKVTWDANGGKIGAKKTTVATVKKDSEIEKFPTTPKRSGYIFKGWFTKKSGGKKITKTIKITKSVRYYTQWTKKVAKANIDSKLIGMWRQLNPTMFGSYIDYHFFDNGTFIMAYSSGTHKIGNYKTSSGKITFTNVWTIDGATGTKTKYPNTIVEYRFEKKSDGTGYYVRIPRLERPAENYLPINYGNQWFKI